MNVVFFLLRTFLYEAMMFRLTLERLPVQFLHVKNMESVTPYKKKLDNLKTSDFSWLSYGNEDAGKTTILNLG